MHGDPSVGGPANPQPPSLNRIPPRGTGSRKGPSMKSLFWRNKQKLWTLGVVAFLLISFLAAIVYYWNKREEKEQDYVEIYVTDLPADFARLDVVVAGVYVGAENYTLTMDRPAFDLLSLHGPEGALKIASGYIPAGSHDAVRIVFQSAEAQLNGVMLPLTIPQKMLTIQHSFGQGHASAFLFDFDLEQSIAATDAGLVFRPVVSAVYVHDYASAADATSQVGSVTLLHPFQGAPSTPPGKQSLDTPAGRLQPTSPFGGKGTGSTTSSSKSSFHWNGSDTPSPTTTGQTADTLTTLTTVPTETEGGLPEPGDAESIPLRPDQVGGWFIQFADDHAGDVDAMGGEIQSAGGDPVFFFGSVPAAYAFLTAQEARALSELPYVRYVEADQAVQLQLSTAKIASRVTDVQNPLLGPKDPSGALLDGHGIGVGIIDVGFDSTHPDLRHRTLSPTNPAFAVNYKVESLFTVDAPLTDVASGHGTHVAGIVAGRGTLDPTQKGVAPAATLYGFAIGEGSTTLWPNTALDWLVQNANHVDPPIKVVTNSWGNGNAYDPDSLTTKLIEKLVDQGVVVVFAAGNAGGDGSMAATTSQCQIPKEGVICVAAYSDHDTGTKTGTIADYSSRGQISQPASWPDLSAPGDSIRSTAAMINTNIGGSLAGYQVMSGTSMAAPHVAGIVALMLQARPGLSPAQVESILEQTALHYADGGSYVASSDPRYDGDHYAKGHGLVDAWAAIDLAKRS